MVTRENLVVRIPKAIYAEMVVHVVEGYPHEACGALVTKEGRVVKHYPTANAAEHPDDFSIIDPQDLLHIYEYNEEYDGEMIYYHSHARSKAYPSQRDKEWQSAISSTILSSPTSTIPNHPMPGCSLFTMMIRWLKGR